MIVKLDGCDVSRITSLIMSYVPEARLESNISAELSYVLPAERSDQFEALFSEIEKNVVELGIASFGASVTTMEEVFLRLVNVHNNLRQSEPGKRLIVQNVPEIKAYIILHINTIHSVHRLL